MVYRWVPKTTHADNHYLDAEVYALAAADILGVRMLAVENMVQEQEPAENINTKRIAQQDNETWGDDFWG